MNNHHTQVLKEVAKFLSGLIAADILFGLWLALGLGQGYQSVFLGIPVSSSLVGFWIIFDLVILFLLIHYAWHVSLPVSKSKKTMFIVIGILLGIVAVLHLARILFGVPVSVGGVSLPMWLSLIGALVAGFLSYTSFHFARQ